MFVNNWIQTNLYERFLDKTIDFNVVLKPHSIVEKTFDEECDITCKMISKINKKIYIGLSGGIDSEFVCEVFLRNQIDFIPIITCYPGNEEERVFAFRYCEEKKLSPIIIEISEKDILDCVWNTIVKKFNGMGMYSVGAIFASNYADANNGVYVEAQHIVGDGDELIESFQFYVSDHDFYSQVLNSQPVILFFLHRLELPISMIKGASNSFVNWMNYKHTVFKRPLRPKIRPSYSNRVKEIIELIFVNRKNKPKNKYFFGNKEETLKKLIVN